MHSSTVIQTQQQVSPVLVNSNKNLGTFLGVVYVLHSLFVATL